MATKTTMTIEQWLTERNKEWGGKTHRISDDLAVANWSGSTATESMREGRGGVGYYSFVAVYFRGEVSTRQFKWRDRYDASQDCPRLSVYDTGQVSVTEEDRAWIVGVTCLNVEANRIERFSFPKS